MSEDLSKVIKKKSFAKRNQEEEYEEISHGNLKSSANNEQNQPSSISSNNYEHFSKLINSKMKSLEDVFHLNMSLIEKEHKKSKESIYARQKKIDIFQQRQTRKDGYKPKHLDLKLPCIVCIRKLVMVAILEIQDITKSRFDSSIVSCLAIPIIIYYQGRCVYNGIGDAIFMIEQRVEEIRRTHVYFTGCGEQFLVECTLHSLSFFLFLLLDFIGVMMRVYMSKCQNAGDWLWVRRRDMDGTEQVVIRLIAI
ncbi:hypothetical protein K501DRAFT_272241 [Backusella circina FSU 941]|nr:hypothetical protein K501DRAFT_272241 [Backusella circina FSU 941]